MLRINRSIFASFLLASALALGTTSAQAIEIGFDRDLSTARDGTRSFEIDGRSITIVTRSRELSFRGFLSPERMRMRIVSQTIRFDDGPVALNEILGDGTRRAALRAMDENGRIRIVTNRTTAGSGAVVTQLTLTRPFRTGPGASQRHPRRHLSAALRPSPLRIGGVTGVDVRWLDDREAITRVPPTNPVPEPGAALLFATGLAATGLHTKRRVRAPGDSATSRTR